VYLATAGEQPIYDINRFGTCIQIALGVYHAPSTKKKVIRHFPQSPWPRPNEGQIDTLLVYAAWIFKLALQEYHGHISASVGHVCC
jgi:hypothetical protein